MKNQWFGDRNDLFKFDLIENMLQDQKLTPGSFFYVPMLTEDESTPEGYYQKAKAGKDNSTLIRWFTDNKKLSRNMAEIMGGYFQKNTKVKIKIKREMLNDYGRYFGNIENETPKGAALIFFDPDTGLEPASGARRKDNRYLRYNEVKRVFDTMDSNSIIMVYQHTWRGWDIRKCIDIIMYRLSQATGNRNIGSLAAFPAILFTLVKSDFAKKNELEKLLTEYGRKYTILYREIYKVD